MKQKKEGRLEFILNQLVSNDNQMRLDVLHNSIPQKLKNTKKDGNDLATTRREVYTINENFKQFGLQSFNAIRIKNNTVILTGQVNMPLIDELQTLAMMRNFAQLFQDYRSGLFRKLGDVVEKITSKYSEKYGLRVGEYDFIWFEAIPWMPGHNNLGELAGYIQRKEVISFKHKRPFEKAQDYTVSPLYLKVYNKRWYLIAFNHNESVYDHFDLTMFVSEIKRKDFTYLKNSKSLKEIYKDVIGITLRWKEFTTPVDIVLRFKKPQHEYALNPKLHGSASEPFNDRGETIDIKFHLVPTYEFIMKILGWNKYVMVMKPITLRNRVNELLQATSKQY